MDCSSNIAFIDAPESLDLVSLEQFRALIEDLCPLGCKRLIISMKKTNYIDSTGIGYLLKLSYQIKQAGGLLSLVCVSKEIVRLLRIARLLDYIPILSCTKKEIAELDPSEVPLWKKTFAIMPHTFCVARQRLREHLKQLPLSETELFDTTLAVGEAIGNALDHTDAAGVRLCISCYRDRLVFDVIDCGSGFDENRLFLEDSLKCNKKSTEKIASSSVQERGRGIKLMKLLLDSVSIERREGLTGTIVHLVKLMR